jgi:diguanylate cyclase (GGDEF)-like protein/hemerythrin-like metal-binding protein/PAS domain S-box-containing protein
MVDLHTIRVSRQNENSVFRFSAIGVREAGGLKLSRNASMIYLIIVLLFCALILAAFFGEQLNNKLYVEASRSDVNNKLGNIRSHLEQSLHGDIQLVKGLVSFISAHPNLSQEEFSRAAKPLFEGGSNLRNIGAAPDLVIRMMYPIAGNEKAIGLDYRNRPSQIEMAERARDTGQMILAGPIHLVQGGNGIISEIPVFVEDNHGQQKFWGLTSAVIDVDRLYRRSGLKDGNLPLEIAIRGKDGKGAKGEVFFGSPELFDSHPVLAEIALPNGSWVMAAVPRGGWPAQADNTLRLRLVFLLVSLLILVPFFILARVLGSLEKAQKQIEAEKNQLAAILNATTESVFHIDRNGLILAMNDIAAHRVQKEQQDMIGKCAFDFFPPEVATGRRASLAEVFRTGKRLYAEDKRNGHFFSLNYYPIIGDAGEVSSVVVYAANITERRENQARMERLLAEQKVLLENDLVGIVTVRNRTIHWANPAFEKMLGYGSGELAGVPTRINYLSDEAYQALGRAAYPVLQAGHVFRSQVEHVCKDGKHIWVDLSGAMLNPEAGESLWGFVDITERKLVESALQESHQQVHLLLNSMAEGAYGVDTAGNCTFVNRSFLRILGFDKAEEVIGQHIHTLIHHSHPDGSPYPASECKMYNAYRHNQEIHASDEVFWDKDGISIPVEYWSQPIMVDGVMQGAIATFIDISERKMAEAQIYNLAFYDSLTRLPNRRLLNDRLGQTLASSRRSGLYGALMFLDLDNFKPLNDTYGHGVGDLLLIEAARRLAGCIRETDTAARFGGDEFVVMIGDLHHDQAESTAQAGIVAEKIRLALSEPYHLVIGQAGNANSSVEHHCTASVGAVVFNYKADREDILKWADIAMYQAKQSGRNRFVINPPGSIEALAADQGGQDERILRLTWHVSYESGDDTIDRQHRNIFALTDKLLESAFTRDEYPKQFDANLNKLLANVIQHFADEEAILALHHYADLEEHARAHRVLIDHALALRKAAAAGGVTIGELVNFLADEMVAKHMLKVDRKFYPLFIESAIK